MGTISSKEQLQEILSQRFDPQDINILKDIPSPSNLKDINKASLKIIKYLKANKKVTIVGDYDVDGVTSSTILSEFFDDIGLKYELIIPNRFKDGYGISPNVLKRVTTDLIITVDNGISAINTAKLCKDKGITLIITDHHKCPPVLPDAYAIVNPKQNDCEFEPSDICGAQVAWYLCAHIKKLLGIKYNLSKYLDLLCIAITADMMPLTGMNRVMVKSGIKILNNSNRVFIKAIKDMFDKRTITFDDLSFLISPLLNSSGRMDDAFVSYKLLSSTDYTQAYSTLTTICEFNSSRKGVELNITNQASLQCENSTSNIIIVYSKDWHEGVLGIVASRLTRLYSKPALVFTIKDGVAKGSARSIGNIDIYNLINKCKDLLIGFGGHKGAAGLGLDIANMDRFIETINQHADNIPKEDFVSKEGVLGIIDPNIIDLELLHILEMYEPYGISNPKPIFTLHDQKILSKRLIGKDKTHQKLIIQNNLELLDFNFKKEYFDNQKITCNITISKNEFKGNIKPSLIKT